jgi:hypothetical protein
MQDKIIDIIGQDKIPDTIEVEYENFVSEMETNSSTFKMSSGKEVRYEDTFQLYQDSSKRFLCYHHCMVDDIKEVFGAKYSDSN